MKDAKEMGHGQEIISIFHFNSLYKFMKEFFREYDEQIQRKTSSSENSKRFRQIEEFPDPGPRPDEALIEKEERELKKEKEPEKEDRDETDFNDISRSPSYLYKTFEEQKPLNEGLSEEEITGEVGEIIKKVEKKELCEKKPNPDNKPRYRKSASMKGYESHGKRGKKPKWKNSIPGFRGNI